MIRSGKAEGMLTLEASLNELVAMGVVSYDDAVAQSMRPKEILRRGAEPARGGSDDA